MLDAIWSFIIFTHLERKILSVHNKGCYGDIWTANDYGQTKMSGHFSTTP